MDAGTEGTARWWLRVRRILNRFRKSTKMAIIRRAFRSGQVGLLLMMSVSCGWKQTTTIPPLADAVRRADAAFGKLPASLPEYNMAVRDVCRNVEVSGINQSERELRGMGVDLTPPPGDLKLAQIEVVGTASSGGAGVPVVIRYEAPPHSHYPPEGLFVNGTATYQKLRGKTRVMIGAGAENVLLGNRTYGAATDTVAAGNRLNRLAGKLAESGFINMVRPLQSERKPKIYLLDPYDARKTPLLMVHGLQSTPLAFSELVNSLRSDPAFRRKYQIWQFHYASGTPVLVNAVALRASLDETVSALDPDRRSVACRSIVVIGHSMGGVISHTLVSSSGNSVWSSVFKVPASQLKGDREAIAYLDHILHFKRDTRISKVIFMAAPHRGSPVSLSVIGFTGNLFTRLSTMEEHRFTDVARQNQEVMTDAAADFYRRGRFSAVRTLSPRSPALIAVSGLPIHVPFHSVIGQKRRGSVEESSDGVVPYWSSHLEGANSEKIVRSGHGIIGNPEAILEVKRILLSE